MKSSNRRISCGEYAAITSAIRAAYGPKNASARGRMSGLLLLALAATLFMSPKAPKGDRAEEERRERQAVDGPAR